MKKYLVTIIAVAVLAVAIVGFVIVNGISSKNPGGTGVDDPGTSDESYSKIFELAASKIVKIESVYQTHYILESYKNDNGGTSWKCTTHPDLLVNDKSVNNIATSFTALQGYIIKGFTSIDDYGFSDGKSNVYAKITLSDGTEHTIYVGNADFSGKYSYVHVSGIDDKIFRVHMNYIRDIEIMKQHIVNMKAFDYALTESLDYLMIRKSGEKALELFSSEKDSQGSAVWTCEYPLKRDAESSAVNQLMTAMRNLDLDGIFEEDAQDLGKYGLDVPDIEYYLRTTGTDGTTLLYKLKVGGKTADNEYYYCLVDDTNDVYLISTSIVYKDISPVNYMSAYVFLEKYTELHEITFTFENKTHNMRIEFEDQKVTNSRGEEEIKTIETKYYDGRETVDDDQYAIAVSTNEFKPLTPEQEALNKNDDITDDIITGNPAEIWNHMLASLYVVQKIGNVEIDEPQELGECIFSVHYKMINGKETTIELFRRDNTTAYLYQDGNYAGGYVRTSYFTGTDYQNYDLTASILAMEAAMKLVP